MDVGEVKARLVADLSDWTQNLQGAQGDLLKFGSAAVAIGNILAGLGEQALEAGKSLITFPIEAAKAAGEAAKQFEQLAQRTGIAVDALQGLEVAMAREGLAPESLAMGFRKLSAEMEGVRNRSAASVEVFTQLGISIGTVEQGTGPLMYAIANRFQAMADGAEKSHLAVTLFGRSGLQLIPILNQGAAGLDAAMQKSAEFGLIMTKTQQTGLTVFEESMKDLNSAVEGFKMQVGAAFAPALTALVHGMTNAVVFAKDTFNLFADAAEKLTIRLAGMVTAIELIGKQLLSFSVFSKQAWKDTLDQVQAIDAWAAAQIKAVDANRAQTQSLDKLAEGHLKAAAAIKVHAERQQILGEQIVKTTQGQLEQQLEASRRYYEEVFTLEENAAKAAYLQGPDGVMAGVGSVKAQELAGQAIIANAKNVIEQAREVGDAEVNDAKARADALMAVQAQLYANESGFIGAADAARRVSFAQIEAGDAQQELVQKRLYEDGKSTAQQYYDRLDDIALQSEAKRMAAIRQFPTFFESQLQSLIASNSFSMATITNQFSGAMASWIVQGTKFKQFWLSLQVTLVQTVINEMIQMLAGWALALLRRQALETVAQTKLLAGHAAFETSKTAITTTEETARSVVTIAQAKVSGAAAISVLTAVSTATIGVLEGIVTAIGGVFEAMAAALAASVVGSPFAPAMAAAGAAAFSAGTAATAAAGAAMTASLSAATGALALAEGGIVNRPTLALIGESGPEAVIPLGAGGGFGNLDLTINMDGRVFAKQTIKHMPSIVRLNLGNAF